MKTDTRTCPRCGGTFSSALVDGIVGGVCPGCLFRQALDGLREATLQGAPGGLPEPVPLPSSVGGYEIVGHLGTGGMGTVYKARQRGLDRLVAVKVLTSSVAPEEVERFLREARAVARLRHPHIIPIHEIGSHDGRYFYVMDLVDGETLRAEGLPRRKGVELLSKVARAVHHAHEHGVIHRDLKPANILVDRGGEPLVADFGLAKEISSPADLTRSGQILGSPSFMAPEQALGERDAIDARTDVYGLGATLYFLLTGRPPHPGRDAYEALFHAMQSDPAAPRGIRADIPRDLETIVQKCLERDPKRRYGSALEVALELDRWLEGRAIEAHPPSALYRMRRFVGRRRPVFLAAAGGLLAVGISLGVLVPKWSAEAAARREDARRLERARPYLEAGRRVLEQMRVFRRDPAHNTIVIRPLAEKAQVEFEAALRECPGHPEGWLGIGRAWRLAYDRERSLKALDRAIELSPEFGAARLERARQHVEQYERERGGCRSSENPETAGARRRREEIEADLERVRDHPKEAEEGLYARGMLAFTLGRHGEAERLLAEYAGVDPLDDDVHFSLGHSLAHLGRHREAVAALTRSIECNGRKVQAYNERGVARLELGELKGAIADFDQALRIFPGSYGVLNNRGEARYNLEDWDGAIADYTAALKILPRYALALGNRGRARARKGDIDGAIADYGEALKIDPKDAGTWANRGLARKAKRDLDGALADLDEALRLEPRSWSSLASRGLVRGLREEYDGAIADLDRSLELHPKNADARFTRGVVRMKKGDAGGALEDFGEAIRLDPKRAAAWRNRAWLRSERKDYDGAVADYSEALKLDPGAAGVWFNRAMVRRARGDPAAAILEDLRKALDLAPADWPERRLAAEILRELGEKP